MTSPNMDSTTSKPGELLDDSSACSDDDEEEEMEDGGEPEFAGISRAESPEEAIDETMAELQILKLKKIIRKKAGLLVKVYTHKKMVVHLYTNSEPDSCYKVCLRRLQDSEGWELYKHRMPYRYTPNAFEPGSPIPAIREWLLSQLHVVQCHEQRQIKLAELSEDETLRRQYKMEVQTFGSIEALIKFVLPARKPRSRKKKSSSSNGLPKAEGSTPVAGMFRVCFSWKSIVPCDVKVLVDGERKLHLDHIWLNIINTNMALTERVAQWIRTLDEEFDEED